MLRLVGWPTAIAVRSPTKHGVGRARCTDGTRRAIVAAFLANLGIAVSKFVAFAITGSASMLAEAIHSVADTGNQGLLFLGGPSQPARADAEHPFGFGTERYFWAFVVALVLFTLGSMFALVEGVEKLIDPEHLEPPSGRSPCSGSRSCWRPVVAHRAPRGAPERGGQSWWRFIRTTKNPELPVVLLEDTGALIGLVFALVGITLAEVTGNCGWDAMGSIGIGLLLGVIAVVLAIEMKSLLIGEAVTLEVETQIRDAIHDRAGGAAHHPPAHRAPRPRRRARRGEARVRVRHHARARRSIDIVEGRVRDSVPPRASSSSSLTSTGPTSPERAGRIPTRRSPVSDTDTRTEATIAAVERFNEAFNAHDVDAVMVAMTDDCVFENTSPPDGQRHEGRAAVRSAWEEFFGSSPTAHFDAEDVIATGDRCVVQWRYTWTNDDGSEGVVRGVDVIRVRDGKVAEKFAYVKG